MFIYSIPTPAVISHSATWLGAADRAAKKGAAAVLINLAILGTNYQVQLNGGVENIPTFSIGSEDATALRTMIETGPVKVKALLVGETKSGLKDANVWGTLPGATDEEIPAAPFPRKIIANIIRSPPGTLFRELTFRPENDRPQSHAAAASHS